MHKGAHVCTKVRNPHGRTEIKSGEWNDDGPGWVKHPEVKAELKPTIADDGIFFGGSLTDYGRFFACLPHEFVRYHLSNIEKYLRIWNVSERENNKLVILERTQ